MNNIDLELEILDKFVKGKRPLVRTHSSNSKFFNKDNTYFMLPDNQEVHKYATALRFCKVYNNEITLEKSRLLYNIYKTSIVDIKEDEITLKIDESNNTKIKILRSAIGRNMSKDNN